MVLFGENGYFCFCQYMVVPIPNTVPRSFRLLVLMNSAVTFTLSACVTIGKGKLRLGNKNNDFYFVLLSACVTFATFCSVNVLFEDCGLKGKQVRVLYSPAAVSSV